MKLYLSLLFLLCSSQCFAFTDCTKNHHQLLGISEDSQYSCISLPENRAIVASTTVYENDGFAFIYLIDQQKNKVLFKTKQRVYGDEIMPLQMSLDKANYSKNGIVFGFDTTQSKGSGVDQFTETHRTLYEIKNKQIIILIKNFPVYTSEYHQGFLDENTPIYTSSSVKNSLVLLPMQDSGHSRILVNSQRFDEQATCDEESINCKEKKKPKDRKSITLKFNGKHYVGAINQLLTPHDEY